MLKKRIIGVVTVRQGWAIQSFGYRRYLPLGKPEMIAENLDRWGADEILIQCIDRSRDELGPDFDVIRRIGAMSLSTPLIYAGGIRNANDAIQAVSFGADRVMLDTMLWENPQNVENVARELGSQAIIAHMPVRLQGVQLYWFNYKRNFECLLDDDSLSRAHLDWVSEVMLSSWQSDGLKAGFDERIPGHFPLKDTPLLAFGGISEPSQIQKLFSRPNIVAVGVGNFLNYQEHAIQKLKSGLRESSIRAAYYDEGKFLP